MGGGVFTAEWWITAGVAGVVASVLAAYMVRWLARGGGAAIAWIGTRTQRLRAVRAARIKTARTDQRALDQLRIEAASYRLDALIGLAVATIASVWAGICSILLLFMGAEWIYYFNFSAAGVVVLVLSAFWFFVRGVMRSDEALEAAKPETPRSDPN